MTQDSQAFSLNGDLSTLDLVLILESRRESAMVSIDIMVTSLLPEVSPRSYKSWIACLDEDRRNKRYYSAPSYDKRGMLQLAIFALQKCLDAETLPKTRAQIYRDGLRVTKYKRDLLKGALKEVRKSV